MATTMKFEDYLATIEFDPEIEMFYGSVVNLSSPVTFYGKSVEELREEFAQSIKVYLEVCEERGIEPEKPFSGRFNIRMTPACHRALAQAAARHGKSLNAFAMEVLEGAIDEAEVAA